MSKRLDQHRQQQPLAELERKKRKAQRRGYWTQEDVDFASAWGETMAHKFKVLEQVKKPRDD